MTSAIERKHSHSKISVRSIAPAGSAVVFVRSACSDERLDEVSKQERLDEVSKQLVDATRKHGVEPRVIVSSIGSGVRDWAERDDLAVLLDYASEGWCDWIVTNRYDRISRSWACFDAFLARLEATGATLVTLDHGGGFDRTEAAETRRLLRRFYDTSAEERSVYRTRKQKPTR